MSKSKILCLHGFGTNANFMKKQSSSFQKLLQGQAELIFVDAPFQVQQNFVVDQKLINLIQGEHRSWYPFVSIEDQSQFFKQMDKLRIAFEKYSDHYDGILGFSQGSVTIHFLLKLQSLGTISWKILEGIKFSINLNGNHAKSSLFKNSYQQLEIPSLHIISEEDFLYPKSILHLTQYKDPLVILHSYGHKFPKLGLSEAKILISFIRKHSGTQSNNTQKFQVLSLSNL